MKYLLLFLVVSSLSPVSAMTPEEATAKLKAIINENRVIVDICIYEQQWIGPTNEFPKGRLIKRAVVTEVYKGEDISLGDKLEFDEDSEELPVRFKDFTSSIAGELMTLFSIQGPTSRGVPGELYLNGDIQVITQDGKFAPGQNNWIFSRTSGVLADAFLVAKQDRSIFWTQRAAVVPPPKSISEQDAPSNR